MIVKAVERVGDKVRLLDQTRLPGEETYHDYEDYRELIRAIRRLEVRGAPAIGITAAYALAVALKQSGDATRSNIEKLAAEIKAARPTAVNLFWAVDRVLGKIPGNGLNSLASALEIIWNEAEAIHEEDRLMCQRIGEYGAELFKDGDTILTHCNTGALATGGIGTALGVIYTCHQQGKNIRVYADETRPLLQGARLTAWELKKAGIPVTLITDNTAGMVMRQGIIDGVIVGADRIVKNGDTANKIGTYSVAVLARAHDIPFYVAAPMSTFDMVTESGDRINIEQRSPIEVTGLFGIPVAPAGIEVYSPAFDVTPNELITAFITDRGIIPGGRK
ncbi:MAG: S-methyl-5-thioribose-1-phosphate isomerase [candidate division Zixibacteria bacterium]|nr:S-methyl-5-thioribose-1-phosphate isomerase [candidate division Zixibacteria bacterium]